MDYISNSGVRYTFSYEELRVKYNEIIKMTDSEFIHCLPSILHFACFVAYLKEIPTYNVLGDEGIIHELVHLLDISDYGTKYKIKEIRKKFKEQLKIA